ncbi:hypothetical protein B0T19DRAFT_440146 [Cercophora scortea]|uniref:Nuclear GTPase SLIP-GC n=1 Tax=Cercophora scortea TaxID=314031 RepID=A0AAE0IY16_9PEZI|nr:hypothetical protein B0T19DRAFT_440146 [Cercophora scortea]
MTKPRQPSSPHGNAAGRLPLPLQKALPTSRPPPSTQPRTPQKTAAVALGDDLMKLDFLQLLKKESSSDKLEAGTDAGLQILEDIKAALGDAKEIAEVAKWIQKIGDLQAKACTRRTVVGVVGSTGAGKSSVINAVLEQECLVPTSGMRACTAVITEIQYNESSAENEKYRAEIHFIGAKDWKKELRVLLDDVASGDGHVGADLLNGDTDVGVAYSKIRAVYPNLARDDLLKGKFTAQNLVDDPAVKNILGRVRLISASSPQDFSAQMQKFIDSKEKTRGRKKESEIMENWPLIKVVKVFVRSPVLESGLVLVDLPGVHDSNAARSAVASKYIENCSGLWVIAPITRAVDDKSAQNLLGGSFRRQLQFDGMYSSVTVICSKTDDLSVTEAMKALPEDAEARELYQRQELVEAELVRSQAELLPMTERIEELGRVMENNEKEIDSVDLAIRLAGDSEEVEIASPGSRKRKPRAAAVESRKRMQKNLSSDSEDAGSESDDDELAEDYEPKREVLTLAAAVQRMAELKAQRVAWRVEKEALARNCKPLRRKIKDIKFEIKDLKSRVANACIKSRNGYSRPAIQQQFADGIRELDQDAAVQRDEDNFDPAYEERDYQKVAAQLPVFCVSSRAFQKLSGRLDKDKPYEGFRSLEDTEIPGLQRHAMGISRSMRAVTCRKFLNDLSHTLASLMVQVVMADKPLKLADEIKEQELKFINGAVAKLQKDCDRLTSHGFLDCEKIIKEWIIDRFNTARRIAANEVLNAVSSWARPKDEGGLPFLTYRATCVREGVFKGCAGPRDFNEEIVDPLKKQLARAWETVFTQSIPRRLDAMAGDYAKLLNDFQLQMANRPVLVESRYYGLVSQQAKNLEEALRDTKEAKSLLNLGQKEANRLFKPAIENAMSNVYLRCGQESGNGCFKRIKYYMSTHAETVREAMFKTATGDTQKRLDEMLVELRSSVEVHVARAVNLLNEDYKSLVAGKDIFEAFTAAREKVRDLLFGADKRFKRVVETHGEESNVVDQATAMNVDGVRPAEEFAAPTTPTRPVNAGMGGREQLLTPPASAIKKSETPSPSG